MALKEMSTILDAEREALELESIPEYLTDATLPAREVAVTMSARPSVEREIRQPAPQMVTTELTGEPHEHDDHIETLWPGLHHDLVTHSKKSPSFYMMMGFMAGAAVSVLGVLGYFGVTQMVAHGPSTEKSITTVAGVPSSKQAPEQQAQVRTEAGGEVIVPSSPQYQVGTGDTLAGIALKTYKRQSPRLLDEICKANNLRNANVLSLGQKLNLPEYRTQAAQVAGAGQVQ